MRQTLAVNTVLQEWEQTQPRLWREERRKWSPLSSPERCAEVLSALNQSVTHVLLAAALKLYCADEPWIGDEDMKWMPDSLFDYRLSLLPTGPLLQAGEPPIVIARDVDICSMLSRLSPILALIRRPFVLVDSHRINQNNGALSGGYDYFCQEGGFSLRGCASCNKFGVARACRLMDHFAQCGVEPRGYVNLLFDVLQSQFLRGWFVSQDFFLMRPAASTGSAWQAHPKLVTLPLGLFRPWRQRQNRAGGFPKSFHEGYFASILALTKGGTAGGRKHLLSSAWARVPTVRSYSSSCQHYTRCTLRAVQIIRANTFEPCSIRRSSLARPVWEPTAIAIGRRWHSAPSRWSLGLALPCRRCAQLRSLWLQTMHLRMHVVCEATTAGSWMIPSLAAFRWQS